MMQPGRVHVMTLVGRIGIGRADANRAARARPDDEAIFRIRHMPRDRFVFRPLPLRVT
jgi:hypothetical protein